MPSTRRLFALFVVILVSVAFGLSQDLDDVTVSGKITDANGLAVVGATVTAKSVETGVERSVTTDGEGRYRIVKLKPGVYKIRAEQQGFEAIETTEIKTISGQNVDQPFKLLPAGVKAETVIAADENGPVIDPSRTVVGGTITEKELEEIPNVGRSPLDLVLTLGGTSEEQLSVKGLAEDRGQASASPPLEQGNFAISGGVAYSNNLTIDGLDNNDDRSSRERFQPSLEGIAEVQVIQNQFSAEYGRASGGRINLRTRSGTNKLRGRAFFFFRDARLNANTWYNNSRGIDRLPLTEYDPGFTLSGPVRLPFYNGHDRT
ncbi:MAG: TonB-dependent receptor, partial [Acidobacteria bacterium]|nr:TonB-dependent receptor [Acidobacteriota bacterium]